MSLVHKWFTSAFHRFAMIEDGLMARVFFSILFFWVRLAMQIWSFFDCSVFDSSAIFHDRDEGLTSSGNYFSGISITVSSRRLLVAILEACSLSRLIEQENAKSVTHTLVIASFWHNWRFDSINSMNRRLHIPHHTINIANATVSKQMACPVKANGLPFSKLLWWFRWSSHALLAGFYFHNLDTVQNSTIANSIETFNRGTPMKAMRLWPRSIW